jgi:serine/threonine protein phosphatase 1
MRWLFPFLTRRANSEPAPCQGLIPEGQRVYAIGDVHGRFDLLVALIDRIRIDNRCRGEADTHIVMLGDLIDRGPDSAHVIEYLRAQQGGFATFHFLCGNHEEVMLATLATGSWPEDTNWLRFGGYETMMSYGATATLFRERGEALAREMRALVPETHIAFLESFADRIVIGDYLFVHAGIRPGIPIDRQSAYDMRWIRSPFLEDERDHGVIVVHGHSVTGEPEMRANRIGIDTGAYRTGTLSALGLEGADRWLIAETKAP